MAGVACRAWFPRLPRPIRKVVVDADVLDAVAAEPGRDQGQRPAAGSIGPWAPGRKGRGVGRLVRVSPPAITRQDSGGLAGFGT